MRVLITGASSGIGFSMAKYFNSLGYDLVLVSRDKDKLDSLVSGFDVNVECVGMDLGVLDNCIQLHNDYSDIDILVNNAGFGLFGRYDDIDLDREIDMINLNVIAVHTLCKLYLRDFILRDSGWILNVGSIAGFMPGPLMGTYYASKNYVVRLSQAIMEELRRSGSNVRVSVLCPGPVRTNFDNVAGVSFSFKGLDSDYVARYAIRKMFSGKGVIIVGFKMRVLRVVIRFVPDFILSRFVYLSQRRKKNSDF